jgi:hypothetical protein
MKILYFLFQQEAVLQTVSFIFEDRGVQDLLVKLYQRGNFFILAFVCIPLVTPLLGRLLVA